MQLVLDDQAGRIELAAIPKESTATALPSEVGELVDCAEHKCWSIFVQRIINDMNRNAVPKRTISSGADDGEARPGCLDSVCCIVVNMRARHDFCPAPRAAIQDKDIVVFELIALSNEELPCVFKFVGRGRLSDPQANRNGEIAQVITTPANRFAGEDSARCPLKLLGGQEAQRVAAEDSGPSAPCSVNQAATKDLERGSQEIGLRLAASCGEPNEVDHFSIFTVGLDEPFQDTEKVPYLKGVPRASLSRVPIEVCRLLEMTSFAGGLGEPVLILQDHGPVGQLKSQPCRIIVAEYLDSARHPPHCRINSIVDALSCRNGVVADAVGFDAEIRGSYHPRPIRIRQCGEGPTNLSSVTRQISHSCRVECQRVNVFAIVEFCECSSDEGHRQGIGGDAANRVGWMPRR